MAKGRHRKQQLTQLPAGVRAMTGKSRSATKAQTYHRLLPVAIEHDLSQSNGGHQRQATTVYTFPAWADYLLSLCGYPSQSIVAQEKQKEQEMNVVVGKWDSLSKSVYLDVTIPSTSQQSTQLEHDDGDDIEQQSASMRYLWNSGFFGKGTLSRSEPTWHKRKVNDIRVKRERQKGGKGEYMHEKASTQRAITVTVLLSLNKCTHQKN